MAGTITEIPTNGAADWTDSNTITFQHIGKGLIQVSLTNMDTTSEPEIEAGSVVEIDGSFCRFLADESITGWAGIANSTDVYIKLTASGTSVAASFTTTAPTWSASKQGFYSGTDRYIGGLHKDASGEYVLKWLYHRANTDNCIERGETRPIISKVFDLGDWDMDADTYIRVDDKISYKAISITTWIYPDDRIFGGPDGTGKYNLIWPYSTGSFHGYVFGKMSIGTDRIELSRVAGGFFDSTDFDSTSYNRGTIHIVYEA